MSDFIPRILKIQTLKLGIYCQLQIGTCQGHLPSASVEIEPCAALAVDLQRPPEGVQGGVRTVCSRESGGTGL